MGAFVYAGKSPAGPGLVAWPCRCADGALLTRLCFPGAQFGTVVSMPLSGLLAAYGFAGGWPSIFYVFGVIGTIWSLVFLFYGHEDPESHPTIDPAERKYIVTSLWGAAGVSVRPLFRVLLENCVDEKLSFWGNQSVFVGFSVSAYPLDFYPQITTILGYFSGSHWSELWI